jgi:hypothetical protein
MFQAVAFTVLLPAARVGGLETQVRQLERERDKLQFTTSRLQDELAEVRCVLMVATVKAGARVANWVSVVTSRFLYEAAVLFS